MKKATETVVLLRVSKGAVFDTAGGEGQEGCSFCGFVACYKCLILTPHVTRACYKGLTLTLQVEKVKKAVEIAKQTRSDLFLEGNHLTS